MLKTPETNWFQGFCFECQDGDLNSGHEDFQSFLVSLCLLGFKIEHLYKS
jgi:hypothetical protein